MMMKILEFCEICLNTFDGALLVRPDAYRLLQFQSIDCAQKTLSSWNLVQWNHDIILHLLDPMFIFDNSFIY